ncbi:MAG: hypothetical protein R2741_04320 [Methanolobus sp.]
MPEDTISTIILKLHESGKSHEFGTEMLKNAEYLEVFEEKCTHFHEELQEDEVRELIDKIRK